MTIKQLEQALNELDKLKNLRSTLSLAKWTVEKQNPDQTERAKLGEIIKEYPAKIQELEDKRIK